MNALLDFDSKASTLSITPKFDIKLECASPNEIYRMREILKDLGYYKSSQYIITKDSSYLVLPSSATKKVHSLDHLY